MRPGGGCAMRPGGGRAMRALLAALVVLLAGCGGARADSASTSYVTARVDGAEIAVEWALALRDLEDAVGLDADGDGAITWGELRAQVGKVAAYAVPRLRFSVAGAACTAGEPALLADTPGGAGYAVLRYGMRCPVPVGQRAVDRVEVAYSALFEIDPRHRGLLALTLGGVTHAAVLSPDRPDAVFGAASDGAAVVRRFFAAGVAHLLGGADHLLFIAMLLVPCLVRPEPGRGAVARLGGVVRLLTAFTLAHAVTLTLAVLGVVAVPARLVEPAVALTILATALDNIRPFLAVRRDALAFGFGLIHGLSVAGGLGPLQLPPVTLALALLAFNLGIEAAQLLLAAGFAPLGACLRATRAASWRVLPTLSGAAAVIAVLWLAQRVEPFL